MVNILKENQKIKESYKKKLGLKNINAVPTIKKIVVSMGLSDARLDPKKAKSLRGDLAKITGARPAERFAKKAISAFKIKQGSLVGYQATLRRKKMYDFLYKLINFTLPRIRDFEGVSEKSLDGSGNLSVGIKEQTSFFEIKYDDISEIHGLEVTIVTDTKGDRDAKKLLKAWGMIFQSKDQKEKSRKIKIKK